LVLERVEINSFGIGSQAVLFVTVYPGLLQPKMQIINECVHAGFENAQPVAEFLCRRTMKWRGMFKTVVSASKRLPIVDLKRTREGIPVTGQLDEQTMAALIPG
jgi:hypothetical protein